MALLVRQRTMIHDHVHVMVFFFAKRANTMRSFVARGRSLKEVAHLKLDPPGKESRPRPRRGKAEAVKTDATPSKEMGAKHTRASRSTQGLRAQEPSATDPNRPDPKESLVNIKTTSPNHM